MFLTSLFRRYSIKISNNPKIISLFYLTCIMSMTDLVAIDVKILRIDSGHSIEEEITELICMNP